MKFKVHGSSIMEFQDWVQVTEKNTIDGWKQRAKKSP